MNRIKLRKYAELAVKIGANVQKGQLVMINCPVNNSEFGRMIAEESFKVGAKDVTILWNDEDFSKIRLENGELDIFEVVPQYNIDTRKYFVENNSAIISVSSLNPEIYLGVDSEKIKTLTIANNKSFEFFSNAISRNKLRWTIVAASNKEWAKKVFPDISEDEAEEKLWEYIFKGTRVSEEDPIQNWEDHKKHLSKKVSYLNKLQFKSLKYKNSLGTDIKVELVKNHLWVGGSSKDIVDNLEFSPNIPSEEVFTMPNKNGTDGIVYSALPLIYQGNIIDDFYLKFKDGLVVDFGAKKGYESLKDLLGIDEGAKRLGEVALVPYGSPISDMNTLFYNTLYDENASCHFAVGRAYGTNIQNFETMSKGEKDKNGVNTSLTHVDFMIGTKDLTIIGELGDGTEIIVFEDGGWKE